MLFAWKVTLLHIFTNYILNNCLSIFLPLILILFACSPKKENDKITCAEQVFAIGERKKVPEHEIFSSIWPVETDSESNLYVGDWDLYLIRKFDKDGNFLFEFGGVGQGPGEFLGGFYFRLDSKQNIYTVDVRLSRLSKFSPEGRFITCNCSG